MFADFEDTVEYGIVAPSVPPTTSGFEISIEVMIPPAAITIPILAFVLSRALVLIEIAPELSIIT